MDRNQLNWIANFIWGIADDVLRDIYVRRKYRDVILPMTVIRRLSSPSYTFLCLAMLSLAGCTSADIGIIDLESAKITYIPYGHRRQVVASVDEETRTFRTLNVRYDTLVVRTFSFLGELRGENVMPHFAYGYGIGNDYALSPKGTFMVYHKDETEDLYLYDFRNAKVEMLWPRISGPTGSSIRKIHWISDWAFLVLLAPDDGVGRRSGMIVAYDVGRKRKTMVKTAPIDQLDKYSDSAVSRDGSSLALTAADEGARIQVIDTTNGEIRAVWGRGDVGNLCWSPDGNTVGYREGDCLRLRDLDTGKDRIIWSLASNQSLTSLALGNGVVIYHARKNQLKTDLGSPMKIISLHSADEVGSINALFNGKWFVIDKGRKMICELGF